MKAGDHNPTRKKFWSEHVENWRSSGLQQREYCTRKGIGLRSFVRWKQILENPAAGEKSLPRTRRRKGHQDLIPLALIPEVPDAQNPKHGALQDAGIRLHVGSHTIDLSVGFHPGTLQALLAMLG